MTEIELKVFLDVTRNFFEKLGAEPATLGPGRVSFDDPKLLDFTGLIEVGGPSSGYVCLTLPRGLLIAILEQQGHPSENDVALADAVYEVSSVVANHARQSLGGRLMISSPTPIMGSDYGPAFPLPIYVTPVRWKQHEGLLILALERA
jgi:hypothetical protein